MQRGNEVAHPVNPTLSIVKALVAFRLAHSQAPSSELAQIMHMCKTLQAIQDAISIKAHTVLPRQPLANSAVRQSQSR